MRILIVDDHEVVRRGVRGLLEREGGIEVCGEAVDGLNAITQARELTPDAVVMDVSMPRMNGLDASREIRRLFPSIRILILSQFDTPEMMHLAEQAGADGYVVKSEAANKLIAALHGVQPGETPSRLPGPGKNGAAENVQELLRRNSGFEAALRESEARLRSLADYQTAVMNSLAEGLYTVDAEGLVTYLNPAAEELLGWTQAELLGKKMHDVTHHHHPDGTPFPASECSGLHVLKTGVSLREHADDFIRKDGRFLPVLFSASPLRSEGKTSGLIVAFRDNTEQRRAREALLRAHHELESTSNRLKLVTNTMTVSVVQCDRELRYVWVNEYFANWLGRPIEEISGHSIEEVVGRDTFERLQPYFRAVLSGEQVSYEENLDLPVVGPRWTAVVCTPTRDAKGQVDGWVAVIRDVTDRRRTVDDLRSSESDLGAEARALSLLNELSSRLLLASDLPAGLWQVLASALDMMGAQMGNLQLLRSDRQVLETVAHRGFRDDFLGFFREVPADNRSTGGRVIRSRRHVATADTETDPDYEALRLVARAAGYRSVLSVPLMSSHGEALGVLSVHFAVPHGWSEQALRWLDLYARQAAHFIERCHTEQALRESEAALWAYREELEGMVTRRTVELTEANHRLRLLTARLLEAQDDERRRLARELHDSAGQTLAAMNLIAAEIGRRTAGKDERVRTLLDDHRTMVQQLTQEIRTTSYLLHPPLLDEAGLTQALRHYARGLADRSGLQIEVEISDELGRLPADREMTIFRIVQEALTNVHRHSGSRTAVIRLARSEDSVELEIQDAGKGIAPEALSIIQEQGAGVGIGGIRERVHHLGGEMKIESDGRGTRVAVTIPLGAEVEASRLSEQAGTA